MSQNVRSASINPIQAIKPTLCMCPEKNETNAFLFFVFFLPPFLSSFLSFFFQYFFLLSPFLFLVIIRLLPPPPSSLPSPTRLCHTWRLFLSLCWLVCRITQKVTGGFGWNFQRRLHLTHFWDGYILVVIWISIWIQDITEGFLIIAR